MVGVHSQGQLLHFSLSIDTFLLLRLGFEDRIAQLAGPTIKEKLEHAPRSLGLKFALQ